jgi:hypothetical protein
LNPGNIALRVQFPNGNETVIEDSLATINWYRQTSSAIGTVQIDFSPDGGANWILVAPNAPNSGSYAWSVPPTPGTDCLIRVSNAIGGVPADTSDAPFAIVNVLVVRIPPFAQIISPGMDTAVYAGTSVTFRGVGTDADGYVTNYVWASGDGTVLKGVQSKFDHVYTVAGVYFAALAVEDNDGLRSIPDSIKVTVLPNTGVEEDARVPRVLALHPNYPNPFNGGTMISYSLDRTMHVRLTIFSVTGVEVARLVDDPETAGVHMIGWDARNREGRELASGMYICRLETPEAIKVRKLLLLR